MSAPGGVELTPRAVLKGGTLEISPTKDPGQVADALRWVLLSSGGRP
jgi:hypothetical protein